MEAGLAEKRDDLDDGSMAIRRQELLNVLPSEANALLRLLNSSFLPFVKVFYCVASLAIVAALISTIVWYRDKFPPAYFAFFNVQALVFLAMPFLCIYFFRESLSNGFVAYIISEASRRDQSLKMKFNLLTHFNILLLLGAAISNWLGGERDFIFAQISALVTTCFYLAPFVTVYSWFVCLIYAQWVRLDMFVASLSSFRRIAEAEVLCDKFPFLSAVESNRQTSELLDSSNEKNEISSISFELERGDSTDKISKCSLELPISVDVVEKRYFEELTICHTVSRKFGKVLLLLTALSIYFAIGVIWALYLKQYTAKQLSMFLMISLAQVLELGIVLSSCNETGHLACREICGCLISRTSHKAHRDSIFSRENAAIILGCIDYAKLDIPYFGNFSLRARSLMAIFGSIIAAIIPGLLL